MITLYQIFISTINKTIKSIETTTNNKRSIFYTQKQELKQWTKIFKLFTNEYYSDIAQQELQKLNLTKIKDTTLYGIYENNAFQPIDISLIIESKDVEKQAQVIAPLLGTNEINISFKKLFYNAENLIESQILNLWGIFSDIFFYEINKNTISIFDNNMSFKNGVFYAVNDGYLHITKNSYEVLDLNSNIKTKTIFKLPINLSDIKEWDTLSINKEKENYSIFKEFILEKVPNYQGLSCVLADILQPLINTEILPIMVGAGGSGKSTVQNMLTYILGSKIIGNINLVSALNNHFEREVLFTHPIVFTSELESSNFKDQSTLKQLISRETTQLNLKHQSVKVARPIAKMLVASNNILKTTDSDGLNRRLCFIAFNSKKIRKDLSLTEFNQEFNKDIQGLVAFIILGAQTLLNKGWDYNTFNLLSDIELQKEFEGQYNPLNNFLTHCVEKGWLKNESYMSVSSLVDLFIVLKQSKIASDDMELQILLDSLNLKQDTKRSLLNKLRGAGLDKVENKLNNRYELKNKVEFIKINNERMFKSNSSFRYQNCWMINNLSLDFENQELQGILGNSTISLDKLDIPNLKEKLSPEFILKENKTGDLINTPLKDLECYLADLFSINAPSYSALNAQRALDLESKIWNDNDNTQ